MAIEKIAVLGAGTMGRGIAQVLAQNGYKVSLIDPVESQWEKALASIDKGLAKLVEKGVIPEKESILSRIAPGPDMQAVSEAQFVCEAASENLELKLEIFKQLDELCLPDIILATNTSSISITRIAAATKRPAKVIGMHWMNPVPLMKGLEIIRGLLTSDETVRTTIEIGEKCGKIVTEANDFPGFIANRLLMPLINEACYALMEGVGTAQAIDQVMMTCANHPMGPLALADLIGLDVCLAIMNVMYDGLNAPKYAPCPLLKKYVAAGLLGRKSGRGFYDYGA
jgi:3-hydroxybutyryl-CoA dehydrogenase